MHLEETLYQELRRLAAAQIRKLPPGQTLQATALVHEAYVRLANSDTPLASTDRPYVFAAAATALRRVLVDSLRFKQRLRRGGDRQRVAADVLIEELTTESQRVFSMDDLLTLEEELVHLESAHPDCYIVVALRFFCGMSRDETATALAASPATVDRRWRQALTLLRSRMVDDADEPAAS